MKTLTNEIKLTIELMLGDIDDGAHGALQSHLYSLLEIKRERLSERVCNNIPTHVQGLWVIDADERIDVIGQNGNDGEHYGRTPEAINAAAFKDAYKEYTLQEVVGDAAVPSWARWVAVDKDGDVYVYSGRPYLFNSRVGAWSVSTGDECNLINNVVPPISFKNCIWEVKG